jgi:fructosamine-3-kinase
VFGAHLAEHHRRGTSSRFGWASDNYLGSTVQKNEARESWVEFFGECRLQYQLRLARQRGLGSREFYRLAERVIERLDKWLGDDRAQPSLLHGDLWSGNFLVDAAGRAVVIDPAVYYGHREAELAMPLLFGGFPPEFFDAYSEAWPLAEGWRERVELYKLYHLLNHLNLFGVGYLDSCLEIVRRFGS